MQQESLPDFIAVEGNIGAGKTTFATMLAREYRKRLILESFADNPFLPPFYDNPQRYAFPVELFFMAERHKQLSAELARADLFTSGIVADYIFVKTLLFARNTLGEEEFRLFSRIYKTMDAGFPNPDLIVYLHRRVPTLQKNIQSRGRSYEQNMQDEYLNSVEKAYFEYFRAQREIPVLILDVGHEDFVANPKIYRAMVEAIARPVGNLVSTVRIADQQLW